MYSVAPEAFGVDGEDLLGIAEVFFSLASLSRRLAESDGDGDLLSVDALQDVLEQTDMIRRAFFRHTFPPTALGVRQSTLSHKVHAFLHSVRLEHNTWQGVQDFLNCTFTYTSDMGTESSFNLASVDIPAFFPHWTDGVSNSHLSLDFADECGEELQVQGVPEVLGERQVGAGAGAQDVEAGNHARRDIHTVDLGGALYLPGMFHIIDNATKDVLKKSEVWESSVRSMLESVLLFFNAFHRRKWFVARCCTGRFHGWSMFFESASPKLEGGRAWGVVSAGVAWVLERKFMLQQAWRADALLAGNPDAEQDQALQDGAKLVNKVDEALQSPLFWAFLDLCGTITTMLDEITRWTQGCPCHGYALRTQLKPVLRGQGPLSCPMRGRRAPEVAEGALSRLLNDLFHFNDSQLALTHAANLAQEERSRIMLDWSAMKVHMRMQFELKLSPWSQLPLSALGVGHWDLSVAQRLLWSALVEWENLSPQQQESAHPHSKLLFVQLRGQVDAFVRSEPASSWMDLERLRAQSVFIPILEQSIERRHAILHQHLKCAPHHSAPFVSLCERKDEVVALVSSGSVDHLARLCEKTRSPSCVAQVLGLTFHEEFAMHLDVESGTLETSVPHCLVASVVYRCDLRTQYRALAHVHKRPPAPPLFWQASGPSGFSGSDGPNSAPRALEDAAQPEAQSASRVSEVSAGQEFQRQMLQFHAWGHLSSAAGSQDFFCISSKEAAPVDASPLMLPLQDVVSAAPKIQKLPLSLCDGPKDVCVEMFFENDDGVPMMRANSAGLLAGEIVEAGAPDAAASSSAGSANIPKQQAQTEKYPYVFFRVIAGAPAHKKLAHTDSGLRLRADHIAVERCDIQEVSLEQRQISVAINHASEPQLFQRPANLESCLLWSAERTKPAFRGHKLTPEGDVVLEAMLKAGAGAQGSSIESLQGSFELSAHAPEFETFSRGLMSLQSNGLVQSSSVRSDVTAWTFTPYGLASLNQVAVLRSPVNLMRLPAARSSDKDVQSLSTLELLARLQEAGFVLEVRSTDFRAEPPPFQASASKPKKWYMWDKSMNVCRNYLLALLCPDLVRKNGHENVRHLQSSSYYAELFGARKVSRRGDKALRREGVLILPDQGTDALADVVEAKKLPRKQKPKRLEQPGQAPAVADAKPSESAGGSVPDVAEGAGGQVRARGRAVHHKSFRWGAVAFTFKQPRSYQVTCPRICTHRHAAGKNTACTKTKTFANEDEEALVIRQLKFWVSQAPKYASRRDHMNRCEFLAPPSDAELEALKIPSDYETEDEELRPVVKKRRIRGKTPDVEPAAKAKAGIKAKAAKAKAKGKGRAKSRVEAPRAVPDEAGSDRSSSSSSSSHSSSSSQSSSSSSS